MKGSLEPEEDRTTMTLADGAVENTEIVTQLDLAHSDKFLFPSSGSYDRPLTDEFLSIFQKLHFY